MDDEIIEIDACLTDDGSKDEILELSETDDELIPTSSKSPSTSDKVRISSHDSGIDVSNDPASTSNGLLYPTEPNMTHVRLELRTGDGSGIYLDNKAVWENTGLIPKYYKPYSLIEADNLVDSKESPAGSVPLYQCHFCKMIYKGHNSIVYHCRRHIGDYPYKCGECNFVEVCKSGLSSHQRRSGHHKSIKVDGPERVAPRKTTTVVSRISKVPESDEFASNVIKNRSDNNKLTKSSRISPPQNIQPQNVASTVTGPVDPEKVAPKQNSKSQLNEPVHKIWGVNTDYSTADISQFKPIRTNSLVPPAPKNIRYKVYEPNTGLIPTFTKPFKIMRLTENKVVYKCDLCGSNYTSWEDIIHHVRRHYGDYPYRCASCGFAGVSKGALELHMYDENHPKSIFLKPRGNHELFAKPKMKPETSVESRASLRESMLPQIRPSIYPNRGITQNNQDDPAIRLQFARIQAAYAHFPQFGSSEINLNAPATVQKTPRVCTPPPKLQKAPKTLLHPARKLKTLSPKPVQTTITTANATVTPNATRRAPKVPKIEEPVACSTPVKKEALKLNIAPPKTPEPSKTKLVIVPQKGTKRKTETDLAPDLTIKNLKEKPDYEYLIWLSERNSARNKLLTHSWEFCDECKSAFYNMELYKSHFAFSPECQNSAPN